MASENEVARALRQGEVTLDEALATVQSDDFIVYPATDADPQFWADVEEANTGSTLITELVNAGADDGQVEEAENAIDRARQAGHTYAAAYGWPEPEPSEADPEAVAGDYTSTEP